MRRVFLLLIPGLLIAADVVPNEYIVQLTAEPLAAAAVVPAGAGGRVSSPESLARRAAIRGQQDSVRRTLAAAPGAEVLDAFEIVQNSLVVRMSAERARSVAAMSGVLAVRPVRLYRKSLDHSLPLQKIPDAWQQIGGADKAGAGIRIAIIDTGIDASHPAFQDSSMTAPDGFPLVSKDADKANTNSKVIVARSYRNYLANDVDGHGTGVAMVAAGVPNASPVATITGVAPKAWLGNYKVFPDGGNGAPDSLIIRAIEDAVNDGMDVMNLSLGGFPATRPEDDSLAQAVEVAVSAGKLVVVAAGNVGSDPNTVASPGTAPSAITAGSSANDRVFAGKVLIDGRDPYAGIPGDGPNPQTPVTAPLKDVLPFDPTGLGCSPLPDQSLNGAIALIERGTCTFKIKLVNAQKAGALAAIIFARPEAPDAISISTGGVSLPAIVLANADGERLRADLTQGSLTATVDFRLSAVGVSPYRLSSYSSRGPNADGGIKPDLLSVGQDILTAYPVSGGAYVIESGTSFSSPTVAGAAALLMAARPGLSSSQYRSLLVNSAGTFSIDGSTPLKVQYAGTGLLNMTASLSSTVAASPVSLSFGVGSATVDVTRPLQITNLGPAADTFTVAALSSTGGGIGLQVPAGPLTLDPGKTAAIPVRLAADQLPPGVYEGYLKIQGSQSGVVSTVPYWYGVPTQTARYLQVLDNPTSVRHSAPFDIYFRALDENGIPVTSGVDGGAVTGISVSGLESDDPDIPGAFVVHLKAPDTPGSVDVVIQVGGVSKTVTITVT